MPATDLDIAAIQRMVQNNCALSDAKYARNYSLCVYLLRMREFYRWHQEIAAVQPVDQDRVGDWITTTEERWDEIEENNFAPLQILGQPIDPFDFQRINTTLIPAGYVYSAGIGRMGQPHFVLSVLNQHQVADNISIYECGQELARDLVEVPAMVSSDNNHYHLFVRQHSIRRYIAQHYEEWALKQAAGPMAAVVSHFELKAANPGVFDANLGRATEALTPMFVAHERGEIDAASRLGPEYRQAVVNSLGTPTEFYLRAVRDLLADSLRVWPTLIEQQDPVLLNFYLADIKGIRRQLFQFGGPEIALNTTADNSSLNVMQTSLKQQQQRWTAVAQQLARDAGQLRAPELEAHCQQLCRSFPAP